MFKELDVFPEKGRSVEFIPRPAGYGVVSQGVSGVTTLRRKTSTINSLDLPEIKPAPLAP
jgi:hypothetical protein